MKYIYKCVCVGVCMHMSAFIFVCVGVFMRCVLCVCVLVCIDVRYDSRELSKLQKTHRQYVCICKSFM